jgi:hypothetical protein
VRRCIDTRTTGMPAVPSRDLYLQLLLRTELFIAASYGITRRYMAKKGKVDGSIFGETFAPLERSLSPRPTREIDHLNDRTSPLIIYTTLHCPSRQSRAERRDATIAQKETCNTKPKVISCNAHINTNIDRHLSQRRSACCRGATKPPPHLTPPAPPIALPHPDHLQHVVQPHYLRRPIFLPNHLGLPIRPPPARRRPQQPRPLHPSQPRAPGSALPR